MRHRRQLDLYLECNVEPRAPLDAFTAECCARCVNPECTRSNFANSKFESRVLNWHDRLFTNVPRMDASDERFAKIAGQRFLLIDPAGSAPTQSGGWVDPRDLEKPKIHIPPQRRERPPVLRPKPEPIEVAPEPEPEPEPIRESSEPEPEKREPASIGLASVNTPVNQGQMIGGRPPPTAAEWKTPTLTPATDDKVVKTGAKIRIGS